MKTMRSLLVVMLALAARGWAQTDGGASPHWSFQPPRRPAPPKVKNAAWVRTPIDAFILARLESAGLTPAAAADRVTLLRRATFDLTGLPPTPEEVEAFVGDHSPRAYAKVIDRLLASPRYGEKWGRHWLDVARYADSNGLDENIAHGNAWRYRDYVVAALNADKRFDRFLVEQIAGDLLPYSSAAQRHEQLIATGFLSLGPKVLAEVDEAKMEMDIIDEQVDTIGRAFMGLTLGCARCHDHKFDPISTQDYYGLAGIFKSTKTMEHFKKIARWWENSLASDQERARGAEHDKRIAAQKEVVAKCLSRAREQLQKAGKPVPVAMQDLEATLPAATQAELKNLRDELARLEKSAPELPSAMGVSEGAVGDVAVHIRGDCLHLGPTIARRFPIVLAGEAQPPIDDKSYGSVGQSGRLPFAQWLVSREHPLTARVLANRLWRWHFGQGLARNADNFGKLGDTPSHPQLLDWLASELMERGWSLKEMHRSIMQSATYQMKSEWENGRKGERESDPDNKLLARFPVRRLQAEEIRDSLLFVSGLLDETRGGSLLHVKNREFFFDHTSKDTTRYDSRRRTLYLPVVRNHLYAVFQLFDATDATVSDGNRATTTVAPQALFFMNSELVTEAAASMAASLVSRADFDDAARIRWLYQCAYGRPATDSQVGSARALLVRSEHAINVKEADASRGRRQAWSVLCQAVLASNEFVFVR